MRAGRLVLFTVRTPVCPRRAVLTPRSRPCREQASPCRVEHSVRPQAGGLAPPSRRGSRPRSGAHSHSVGLSPWLALDLMGQGVFLVLPLVFSISWWRFTGGSFIFVGLRWFPSPSAGTSYFSLCLGCCRGRQPSSVGVAGHTSCRGVHSEQ